MNVRVYREGYAPHDGASYDHAPRFAAERYAADHADRSHDGTFNLCVEPLDDEARALPGWHSDEDSAAFRMFEVRPRVEWEAKEVEAFG